MRESEMLKRWVAEQMKEAAKYRDEESKILGKVYTKVNSKEVKNDKHKRDGTEL